MENLPPETWKFLEAWPVLGPIFAFLWIMNKPIMAFFSQAGDKHDTSISELTKLIDELKAEMRALREDGRVLANSMSDMRDRISRIEGVITRI